MALYRFDDLLLEVQPDAASERARLPSLLSELSWTVMAPESDDRCNRLSLRLHAAAATVPASAHQTLSTSSFSGYQLGDLFYLTDNASVLRLDIARGEAEATLRDRSSTNH